VCDACFRMGQTFDFHPPPSPTTHVRSMRTLRRQNSDECLSSAAGKNQRAKAHNRSLPSLKGLRPISSAPCLHSMADSPIAGQTWPQNEKLEPREPRNSDQLSGSDDDRSSGDTEPSSSNPGEEVRAPKASDEVTLPQQIKSKGMGPRRESQRTIAELAAQDEELAAKLKKLEANYTHSSYYQGLLEYEPEALKVLLMSEVSMQRGRPVETDA